MKREHLSPRCRAALTEHQRVANEQARAWLDRKLRSSSAPGRYDVTVSFSGEELRASIEAHREGRAYIWPWTLMARPR